MPKQITYKNTIQARTCAPSERGDGAFNVLQLAVQAVGTEIAKGSMRPVAGDADDHKDAPNAARNFSIFNCSKITAENLAALLEFVATHQSMLCSRVSGLVLTQLAINAAESLLRQSPSRAGNTSPHRRKQAALHQVIQRYRIYERLRSSVDRGPESFIGEQRLGPAAPASRDCEAAKAARVSRWVGTLASPLEAPREPKRAASPACVDSSRPPKKVRHLLPESSVPRTATGGAARQSTFSTNSLPEPVQPSVIYQPENNDRAGTQRKAAGVSSCHPAMPCRPVATVTIPNRAARLLPPILSHPPSWTRHGLPGAQDDVAHLNVIQTGTLVQERDAAADRLQRSAVEPRKVRCSILAPRLCEPFQAAAATPSASAAQTRLDSSTAAKDPVGTVCLQRPQRSATLRYILPSPTRPSMAAAGPARVAQTAHLFPPRPSLGPAVYRSAVNIYPSAPRAAACVVEFAPAIPSFPATPYTKSHKHVQYISEQHTVFAQKLRILTPNTVGQGITYYLGPEICRTKTTKVLLARGEDCQDYIAKILRIVESKTKGALSKKNKYVTHTVASDLIDNEVKFSRLFGSPFGVLSHLTYNGNAVLVMRPGLGDGNDIIAQVPEQHRSALFRVMLEDVVTMLADKIHAQGIVHGDVNFSNTLVDKQSGITYVSDFSSCVRAMHPSFYIEPRFRHLGTYFSPERIEEKPPQCKSDVWELGASALTSMLSSEKAYRDNPFWYAVDANKQMDRPAMRINYEKYNEWLASRRDTDGFLDVSRMVDIDNPYDRLFRRCMVQDPEMTQYIVDHCLCDEARRVSSGEWKLFLRYLNTRNFGQPWKYRMYLRNWVELPQRVRFGRAHLRRLIEDQPRV